MKKVLLIVMGVLVLDQVTKLIITGNMEIGQSIPVIDNFLYITYHRNAGAAFGLFQGQMLFFYVATLVAIGAIVLWLKQLDLRREWIMGVALALLLGGALGNFIDRILNQSVVDFVHTVWWGNSFPIFNVADIALTIGAIIMVVDVLFLEKRRNLDPPDQAEGVLND